MSYSLIFEDGTDIKVAPRENKYAAAVVFPISQHIALHVMAR
jgi:hypothetical protein